tara:strand:- start:806 stop:1051 length:246 start_codon:yes stop_codon:yes gene_type:complete
MKGKLKDPDLLKDLDKLINYLWDNLIDRNALYVKAKKIAPKIGSKTHKVKILFSELQQPKYKVIAELHSRSMKNWKVWRRI